MKPCKETSRVMAFLWIALLCVVSLSFAEDVPVDSVKVSLDSAETLLASFSSENAVSQDSAIQNSAIQDSTIKDSVQQFAPTKDSVEQMRTLPDTEPSKPAKIESEKLKTVLYIDGSKYSEWFSLGVLYAFEAYGVKVDSIVANSYGAWVGALWKSGYSLDDIQRELRQIGSGAFANSEKPANQKYLPLADSGLPALRARFAINFDNKGNGDLHRLPLQMDSLKIADQKNRLHLEEVLYRKPVAKNVSVVTCNGALKNGPAAILSTMPFEGNLHGNGCKIPLPKAESNEHSLIVSAIPLREPSNVSARDRIAYYSTNAELEVYSEAAVIIRPLALPGETPESWIQSGFSETEKKLSALSALQKLEPYTTVSDSTKPWFRYVPTPDSIPAELQQHLMSYWDENDTGFVAVENFLSRVSESSMYESVELQMQPSGVVLIQASAPFQVDTKFGGFGNTIFGPFAYGDVRVRYINQFEYEIGTSVFYGLGGYGVSPELKLRRFLQGGFDFSVRYDFATLRPLKSYLNEQSFRHQIYEERKGDFVLSADFYPNELQRVTLATRVGRREYKVHEYYSESAIKVMPLSPELELEQKSRNFDQWFGTSGYVMNGSVGMESVGSSFGNGESVPIFWKFKALASGAVSPLKYLTVGGGAAFGANIYRENGEEFPPSFGYEPVDWTIRQGIEATPWSAEWYSAESRSHEYGLVRANVGLGRGPLHLWLFGAFVKDFENPVHAVFSENRLVLEPAIRFAYGSLTMYAGLSRTVSSSDYGDLGDLANYHYFVKVGNFDF